jgi:hypothetical protein
MVLFGAAKVSLIEDLKIFWMYFLNDLGKQIYRHWWWIATKRRFYTNCIDTAELPNKISFFTKWHFI